MTEPLNIDELRPSDTPEYMTGAWLGCISWAITVPEILDAFRNETGAKWKPGRSPIERMIDQSTGVDRAFIEHFIKWANVNVWGSMTLDVEAHD